MTSVLARNTRKAFIHRTKNMLFGYDVIRGIQQATSISFFPSVGNQSGQSFPARSPVPP